MPLDPVLQQLIDSIPALPEGPIDYPATRKMAGEMAAMLVGPDGLAEVASVENISIDGTGGKVPLRIYSPAGDKVGTMHYIHGGGWSLGDLDSVDATARRLCCALSMTVITSTYRLAPEHPFPAGFEDTLAAARWVSENRAELGGKNQPALIGGDSAGGNFAAAVCIAMRDASDQEFDAQLLLYPATDLRTDVPEYASRLSDADPALRLSSLRDCLADYLTPSEALDPRASPLAASSLSNLPPALIVVLDVDPLRDEGIAYADALRKAGNRVELLKFDHLTHGFVYFYGIVPAAAAATNEVITALKDLLVSR